MKNPYEELELKKDFTSEELKSKYRELSKKYHPDLNKGSDEKFINLKKAYDILSDPKKRKYFDETGTISDDLSGDSIKTLAKEGLFGIIEKVIYNPSVLQNFENTDIIKIITKVITDNLNMNKQNLKKLTTEYKTARKISSKLKYKGKENNFINEMLKSSIKQRKDNIKNLSVNLKVLNTMLEIVKDYNYDFEEVSSRIFTFNQQPNFTNWKTTSWQ